MKILVAHSNMLKNDPKQKRKMKPYPPLATLYAVSRLRKLSSEVFFYDVTFAPDISEFQIEFDRIQPDLLVVYEDLFNYITKMCLTEIRQVALSMCRYAFSKGCRVIAAGPDMNDMPELYLKNGADYVLLGEPDESLELLVKWMQAGDSGTNDIPPGIAYKKPDGELIQTGTVSPATNINDFPFPAWDIINLEQYRTAWLENHGLFSLIMVSSRGCPYQCNWCAKPIWQFSFAQRSPENTVQEMVMLKKYCNPDHIWFADDIFGYHEDWIREFSKCVHQADAVIPYTLQTRLNHLGGNVIFDLKTSGCEEVWIGVESGSQKIINAMNKNIDLKELPEAVAKLKKNNIRVCFFLQFGYPGETLSEIRDTIQIIRELSPDDIGVSVSYPLPGTEFFRHIQDKLGSKNRWLHSDDLDLMFQGAYESPFYKKLHDVLHLEVEMQKKMDLPQNHPCNELKQDLKKLIDGYFELGRMEHQYRLKTD